MCLVPHFLQLLLVVLYFSNVFVDFELWADGSWQLAARLEAIGDPGAGHRGKVALEYDQEYATRTFGAGGSRALSCRYPPSFELWIEAPWPAFVFDILPAGAARRSLVARRGQQDSSTLDWPLLGGAHFPPGNIRVCPEDPQPQTLHAGFSRAEVVERGPDFVEYAFQRGAPVAGSTGAQGEAPKFLLAEDHTGRWHAEGALPERQVAQHWLVKFPRGRHPTDQTILAEEARYMELARGAGLRVNRALSHEDGCLFVPRFDRLGADCLGLESLASLSGISGYGAAQSLQQSARVIARHCTDPPAELRELLLRDVFNLAVGNTDNHLRNTSVLKYPHGRVELSPLYDLAPMILDREGIPRASRWGQRERSGDVDWAGVVSDLETLGGVASELRDALGTMAELVGDLANQMRGLGVDRALVDLLRRGHTALAHDLERGARA